MHSLKAASKKKLQAKFYSGTLLSEDYAQETASQLW